uniref:EF-hand calcium-binding domain-containing protein 7 n=1 Tax=Callorhinchus milii TaxID=7868 RepID=A0A4W3I4G6_CALMI
MSDGNGGAAPAPPMTKGSGAPPSASSQHDQEAAFYRSCRAAYLTVFRSSLENISSREQLCLVLQQAGRNPSRRALRDYWGPDTRQLNFDDFCEILKREKDTGHNQLLAAFRTLDHNNDGFITHERLCTLLTTKGERMTYEEVKDIVYETDVNGDGKMDYAKFCKSFVGTVEECQRRALVRMDRDAHSKRQQFGSEPENPPEDSSPLPSPKASLGTILNSEAERTTGSANGSLPSRPSSVRTRRDKVSPTISVTASTGKGQPKSRQDWPRARLKGCFYLDDDGGIVSHWYRLELQQTTIVFLSIRTFNLSQDQGKQSPWMSVDTSLYPGPEPITRSLLYSALLQGCGWKGRLQAGEYHLLPFTSGCSLGVRRREVPHEASLIQWGAGGELSLTQDFRAALSDIFEIIDLDGNGLLSLEEYNLFELRASGEECDREAWGICTENFDMRRNELTRQGFMDLNLMEAKDRDGDPSDLWVTLESMGYNRALEMHEACPFVVDVYAEECKPSLRPMGVGIPGYLLDMAVCQAIVARGEARAMKGYEAVLVHTYRTETRISTVIQNKSASKVTVHVDSEQSKNCVSSRGLSVFAVEVAPRSSILCTAVSHKQSWIE